MNKVRWYGPQTIGQPWSQGTVNTVKWYGPQQPRCQSQPQPQTNSFVSTHLLTQPAFILVSYCILD